MIQEKYKVSMGAFAIITKNQNDVILCHRTDMDLWNLPGGMIEKDENAETAVLREVKEETGYDVSILNFLGVYFKKEKDDIVFLFECKVEGGEITTNPEADMIEYFDINNLPKNTMISHIERIHDFSKWKGNTIIKTHKI